MLTVADILSFIAREPQMMRTLAAVDRLALPDCWIGAGFVRNAVWDALHGQAAARREDIDVVWFDAADASPARDVAIEASLAADRQARWDVKNQARMHRRNAEAPYAGTVDAIAHWPETATAVAVCLRRGQLELIAPHGIGDLVDLIARPTPAFRDRREIVAQRIRDKGWQARWPKLRVVEV